MKRISAASSALAAATLVSTMALMGASGVLASEPLRLSVAQMDTITAGAKGSASNSSVKTTADSLSGIQVDNKTTASVHTTTTGEASGDAATSDSWAKTSAKQTGVVIMARGVGKTKATGEDVKVTATSDPHAKGAITKTISRSVVNEKAGVAITVGFALSVNPKGKVGG